MFFTEFENGHKRFYFETKKSIYYLFKIKTEG